MAQQLDQSEAKLAGIILDNLSAEASTTSIRVQFYEKDDRTTSRTPDAGTLKFTIDPENSQGGGRLTEFIRCASHSTTNGITTLSTVTRGLQRDATTNLTGSATRAQSWDANTPIGVTTEPHNMNLIKEYFEGATAVPGDMTFSGDNTFSGTTTFSGSLDVSGGGVTIPTFADTIARDAFYSAPTGGEMAVTGGILQHYNGVTVQWEDADTGTPPGVATDTSSGLVRLADQTQVNAGTDTESSSPLVAQPSLIATAVQDNEWIYAADTGSANSYAIAPTPAISAYSVGQKFILIPANSNTGASNLNVSSLGAVGIRKENNAAVVSGDLVSGGVYFLTHNGTNFRLCSPVANAPLLSSASNIEIGNGSWAVAANGETLTINHGLGRTPRCFTFIWGSYFLQVADAGKHPTGILMATSSSTKASFYRRSQTAGTFSYYSEATYLEVKEDATVFWRATITTFNSTQIIFTTSSYSSTEGIYYTWKAE